MEEIEKKQNTSDNLYMNNLLISFKRIQFYCTDLTEAKLDKNPMLRDAISLNINRIGDCIVKISDELKSKYKSFPTFLSVWAKEEFSFGESELWEILNTAMSPLDEVEEFEKIYEQEYNLKPKNTVRKKIKKELPLTNEHKYSIGSRKSIWTVKKK